jgi:UDP-N-acetylmuramate--alanine ligase
MIASHEVERYEHPINSDWHADWAAPPREALCRAAGQAGCLSAPLAEAMLTSGPVRSLSADRTPVLHPGGTVTRRAHLVGACGSGMAALAELLAGMGWQVTGSDSQAEPSESTILQRGYRIHPGHSPSNVPGDADLLIYSPAIPAENVERQLAGQRGIVQLSYSQMLGELMRDSVGICVAGTHGKSTTTAMVGWILIHAGFDPSVVVGARLQKHGDCGRAGEGPHFVVESCEYRRNFLDLRPRLAAILNIEPDHFDCFGGLADVHEAFAGFAKLVPAEGAIVIPAGNQSARSVAGQSQSEIETFGIDVEANWSAVDLRRAADGTRFRAFHNGEFLAEVSLRLWGRHNVSNALAALALACRAGVEAGAAREALAEFPGICRRFEVAGHWRGVTLIDDYAHHPTAIRATLSAARERYPHRRLWCLFQPHQVSRTTALFREFAEALSCADRVLVTSVFAAREAVHDEPQRISKELAREIEALGTSARFVPALDQALPILEDELRAGDVLLAMGAGDICKLHHAFTRRLQRHHARQ